VMVPFSLIFLLQQSKNGFYLFFTHNKY